MVLKIILGVILALILITAIRAIFFVPKKSEKTKAELPDEAVDVEHYTNALSDAIKIKTISNYDAEKVDWNEFEKFHAFLEERFPLIHKTLTKTKIAQASLIFK